MGWRKPKEDMETAAAAAAADEAPKKASAAGCCCASLPLFQVACTLAVLAATIIYAVQGGTALGSVRELMTELKVSNNVQGKTASAASAILGGGLAVLLGVLSLAAVATIASTSRKARRYRMRHGGKVATNTCGACCEVSSNGLVIALMWIFLALTVALIALWTAFFLGSFSGDHGASYAMGTTDALQQKIASALKKADGLFIKMRSAWDGLLKRVPSVLSNTSWFKDLTRDIGGPLNEGSKDMEEVSCPENCMDLGVFATMMQFEPRCVCSQQMLTAMNTKLRTAWRDSIWALAALTAAAVAGSFMLMSAVASLINSKRDLREIKALKKVQAGATPAETAPLTANDVEAAAAPDQFMARSK